MDDLPPAVVEDLIALGRLNDRPTGSVAVSPATQDQILGRLKPFNRVNFLGWDRWNEAADALPEVELKNLARGLTIAEMELGWRGGSVAGVIWVFRRYESRFPDRARELADWVMGRSKNPYAPFGYMRPGASRAQRRDG